jgi:hypothetical protein
MRINWKIILHFSWILAVGGFFLGFIDIDPTSWRCWVGLIVSIIGGCLFYFTEAMIETECRAGEIEKYGHALGPGIYEDDIGNWV